MLVKITKHSRYSKPGKNVFVGSGKHSCFTVYGERTFLSYAVNPKEFYQFELFKYSLNVKTTTNDVA